MQISVLTDEGIWHAVLLVPLWVVCGRTGSSAAELHSYDGGSSACKAYALYLALYRKSLPNSDLGLEILCLILRKRYFLSQHYKGEDPGKVLSFALEHKP